MEPTPTGAPASLDKRIVRRNYGNNHGYKVDGVKATGITAALSGAIPKNLTGWAARSVGEAIFDYSDEEFKTLKSLGRAGFSKAMEQVPFADRDKAANKGTAVHKLAERLAMGEEIEVPDELAGHVDSYVDFDRIFRPEQQMVEIVVAHLKWKYAGTLDAWAHLPSMKGVRVISKRGRDLTCNCKHECLSIIDIKTSRSGVYGEAGLQICAYGYASHYIDAAGNIREMPKIDHYYVLWLRSDGFDLYPMDVDDELFRNFLYCLPISAMTAYPDGTLQKIKGDPIDLDLIKAG